MNGTVLAIGTRPDLLDRRGQPGRTVGDDQPWRGESAAGEVAAELEQSSLVSRIPRRTETSARSPFSVIPQAQITPSFGPLGRTGR